jgi:Uma2 family endonuclease
MPAERLLTAEEFALLGEGRRELVRGRVVEMTPPAFEHGSVLVNLAAHLKTWIDRHPGWAVAGGDPGFRVEHRPDTVRAPDIAVVRRERCAGHDLRRYLPFAPDLAVEVLSPGDTAPEARARAAMWLSHGAHLVWMVDPVARRVTVHALDAAPRELGETDTLDGGGLLPGFTLPVPGIFA